MWAAEPRSTNIYSVLKVLHFLINSFLHTTMPYQYTIVLFTEYSGCCKHVETRINCVRGTWLKQVDRMRDYFNVVYQLHYAGFIILLTLPSSHSLPLFLFCTLFSLNCTKHTRIIVAFFILVEFFSYVNETN